MIETDIDFPHSLPVPLREGYDIQHVRPYVRTGMESGRARQRRRFTSVPSMVSVSWLFTESQAMAFESWFRDSINDGVDWFNCTIRTPLGLKPYVCRFGDEMYSGPTLTGRNLWRVRAPLEIYERPLLPRGWGVFPDIVAGMDILDIALNREWPEA